MISVVIIDDIVYSPVILTHDCLRQKLKNKIYIYMINLQIWYSFDIYNL